MQHAKFMFTLHAYPVMPGHGLSAQFGPHVNKIITLHSGAWPNGTATGAKTQKAAEKIYKKFKRLLLPALWI